MKRRRTAKIDLKREREWLERTGLLKAALARIEAVEARRGGGASSA
jgi:hypothetical protein